MNSNSTLSSAEIEELKDYLQEIAEASRKCEPTEETLQAINNRHATVIFKALSTIFSMQQLGYNEIESNITLHGLLQQIVDNEEGEPQVEVDGLPSIQRYKLRPVEEVDFPLDKINRHIWSFQPDADGQYTFNFNMAPKDKAPVPIYYSLDFDSLEDVSIVKTLNNFDRRVYTAVGGLFKAGYPVITLQQIYSAMGGIGRASQKHRDKINDSITKMNSAHIKIDNMEEVNAEYKYERFSYDGSLLPMERISAILNGQLSESAIRAFREPPVISLARSRKQLTTIDVKLLQTPMNQTDENLSLEHYMITEIEGMKTGRRSKKMLYKTICVGANITSPKQIYRAPEKIKKVLDYWIKCGYISGYEDDKDGIIIILNKKKNKEKS